MEDTIDYKPFFGLLEEPFNTVASPRFFFLSPIHAIALNKSVFTVDNRKGVSVVWGDIGTGKSTLARIMHERFLNKGYSLPDTFFILNDDIELDRYQKTFIHKMI